MEQLIYTIDRKNYVLIEEALDPKNPSALRNKIKKYDAILQGVGKMEKGGFFSAGFAIMKILVPEQNALKFSRE